MVSFDDDEAKSEYLWFTHEKVKTFIKNNNKRIVEVSELNNLNVRKKRWKKISTYWFELSRKHYRYLIILLLFFCFPITGTGKIPIMSKGSDQKCIINIKIRQISFEKLIFTWNFMACHQERLQGGGLRAHGPYHQSRILTKLYIVNIKIGLIMILLPTNRLFRLMSVYV